MAGRETGEWKDGQDAAWRHPCGEAEASQVTLGDVFDFVKESALHPGARMRQAELLADGLCVGATKEAGNQLMNHTGETAWKALGSTMTGAGFGIALASGNRFLKGGAGAVSSLMLLGGIKHEVDSIVNDKKLAAALDAVWKNGDAETLRKAKQVGEAELGTQGFEIGLGVICGTAGGGAAGFGIRTWEAASAAAKAIPCEGDTCEIGWKPGKPPGDAAGQAAPDRGATIRDGVDVIKRAAGEREPFPTGVQRQELDQTGHRPVWADEEGSEGGK